MGTHEYLPEYQCRKKVRAIKISEIVTVIGNSKMYAIVPCREYIDMKRSSVSYVNVGMDCPSLFYVSDKYVKKHSPQKGGYYVVYEDGHESYSPAKAFEQGYTLIEEKKICE